MEDNIKKYDSYIELNNKIKELLIFLLLFIVLIIINILCNKYMLNAEEGSLMSLTSDLACKVSSLSLLLFATLMIINIVKLASGETIKKYNSLTKEDKETIKSAVIGIGQGIIAFWVLDHIFKK